MTAPMVLDGPINVAFQACIEQVLAPTVRRGDPVIIDNLPAHKGDDAPRHRSRRGNTALPAALLTRPQPDRERLSKLKAFLRKAAARINLWNTIRDASPIFTPQDSANYFTAARSVSR